VSLFMLIGEDLAAQIAGWRDAARIADLATIVVLVRATLATPSALESTLPMTKLATRRIELSSTEIRDRVRAGRSIHGFVTDAVAAFIGAAGLYR
jgi:nicotinate-nucleotide adenylyltransferase